VEGARSTCACTPLVTKASPAAKTHPVDNFITQCSLKPVLNVPGWRVFAFRPGLPGTKFHREIRRSLGRIAARLLQIRGGVIELLQARTSHAGGDFHPLV
jgi:hypothetical protein